jgi:hypothetical protein
MEWARKLMVLVNSYSEVSIVNVVETLKETCQKTLADDFNGKKSFIEWIPIEWHSKLHQLDTAGSKLSAVTLPTMARIRHVCNEILSDALYYFTSFHGQHLINIVCKSLNEMHAKILEKSPNFSGSISILAHSLGSVIIYDLLANQKHHNEAYSFPDYPQENTHFPMQYPKLAFKVKNFFAIGSPLGALLVCRGQTPETFKLPKSVQFFNIFNLYDPVVLLY